MNYKNKSFTISLLLIFSIQLLLLINNRQKSSFRYFIWNIQEVSIGRLIFISFVSGLLMSTLLNKTVESNIKSNPIFEADDKPTFENDKSENRVDNNETYEPTPERDLRDPQPTISVNYRVIKNNGNNELEDLSQTLNNSQYEDDWSNNGSEW